MQVSVMTNKTSRILYKLLYYLIHRDSKIKVCMSVGPVSETSKRVHYWVVLFQSKNSGYEISRLCPSKFSILFSPVK